MSCREEYPKKKEEAMTTLTDLERLARAATQTCTAGRGDCPACKARNALGAQGRRVLDMIAVIEAADGLVYEMFNGMTPSVGSVNKYQRVRAALDKEQT